MITYAIIDLVFIGIAIGVAKKVGAKPDWHMGLVLILATIFFDNVITELPIVTYQAGHYLGIRLGHVPLEDFGYPVAAIWLIPSLWKIWHEPNT